MEMILDESWELSLKEQTCIIIFLNHCFNSLEVDLIRNQVQRLVSLPIWICLPEVGDFIIYKFLFNLRNVDMMQGRREQELNAFPKLKKFWKNIQKKYSKESEESRLKLDFERRFLKSLMLKFLHLLTTIPLEGTMPIFLEYDTAL